MTSDDPRYDQPAPEVDMFEWARNVEERIVNDNPPRLSYSEIYNAANEERVARLKRLAWESSQQLHPNAGLHRQIDNLLSEHYPSFDLLTATQPRSPYSAMYEDYEEANT